MAILESNAVQSIATRVSEAISKVATSDGDKKSARDGLNAAGEASNNTRENMLVGLANAAASEKWETEDLTMALERVLSARNDGETNSIKTFANEIKAACHRSARRHVASLRELATKVWDAEVGGDKGAPKPCRDAFVRRYHMLRRLIGKAIEGEVLTDATEVVGWAIELNQSKKLDPKRGFKALETVRKAIKALHDDFPLDGIVSAVEDLSLVEFNEFKKFADDHARRSAPVEIDDPDPEDDEPDDTLAEPVQGVYQLNDDIAGA